MTDISAKQNKTEKLLMLAFEWIKNNRSTFFSIVGITAAVVAFTTFFFTRYHTLAVRASDKLSMAQGLLYQGQGEQGIKMLDEIIAQYSRTAPAFRARMIKASILSDQKKYKEAESTVRPVAERGRPAAVRPLAYPVLGAILENGNNQAAAIAVYEQFNASYPGHFLAPKIMSSLALLYESSGNREKAKAVYEKIALQFPGTPWAQRAQQFLAQGQPPAAIPPR